ncbi:MAG: hypothetical protein M5U11_10375 [Anaerolineales bacterium]|jgi:putative cell wall-binding protein|nr:hypothetical protein [Anaerolineales bacterium]GER80169.1 conserved hypothetical protein [Candidatus Denitrolinea symbiosum]
MKTILQILVILLLATAVSAGVYALVENTSLVSSSEAERGAPPQMTGTDSQSMPARPEGGDEHSASFSRGMSEVGMVLAKLSVITVLILLIQKAIDLLRRPKLKPMA